MASHKPKPASHASARPRPEPEATQCARAVNGLRIRRGPGGKADWLVSIEGVCTDTHFRDPKLRNYRKFCNAIKHRFGVIFDPKPLDDWLAIVETAIGGASS